MEIEEYTYQPGKFSVDELFKLIEDRQKKEYKKFQEKAERIKNKLSIISKRQIEYGEEVPTEVLVIIHLDQPIGSEMYDKYKKWLR